MLSASFLFCASSILERQVAKSLHSQVVVWSILCDCQHVQMPCEWLPLHLVTVSARALSWMADVGMLRSFVSLGSFRGHS